MRVVVDLEEVIATEGKAAITSLHKFISLAIIDQSWTSHLREMDDLKQAVHNASYEQKDPLLIYKFEGFELFKRFVAEINNETVNFLLKYQIPEEQPQQVSAPQVQQRRQLNENKQDSESALNGERPNTNTQNEEPQVQQLKSQKLFGRNDRVSVQYLDGNIVKDVKFKTVESDVVNNKCVVLEDEA